MEGGLTSADSNDNKWVEIDGSFGEGGGQLIRNAVTLASILRKKIRVIKIRANRPNPGLASQHLYSILALKRFTGAKTSEIRKGTTAFDLNPSEEQNTDLSGSSNFEETIDLVTAGSVMLCVQALLPYLLSLSVSGRVTIIGGTHVLKAPNTDYMNRVFFPSMTAIGYNCNLQQIRPGYFPRGGGIVVLSTAGGGKFHHLNMNTRGRLLEVSAILNLTPPLFKDNQARLLAQMNSIKATAVETRRVSYASVEYFLKYEHASFGFYRLVEGRPPKPTADEVDAAIKAVELEVNTTINSHEYVSVDSFMQDQLIIYMTLAKLQDPSKNSSFTTLAPLTEHTRSAIHVCGLLSGLKFHIQEVYSGTIQILL